MSDSQQLDATKRLQINLDLFVTALDNHGIELQYFLNVKTGHILIAGDGTVDGEEADIDDILDENPDLYLEIEGIPSSKGFRVMEQFVQDIAPFEAKDALWRALEKPKPFRQFKDALVEMEKVQEKWVTFEAAAYLEFAKAWLKENGIKADLVKSQPTT